MTIARAYLVLIVVLCFGWGARKHAEMWLIWPDGDFRMEAGLAYFFGPLALLLFLWCRADAKARRVKLSFAESIMIPLLFPIGVPYYFFRSHDVRPAFVHVALAVAFAGVCIGAMWLGARTMFQYYAVWANPATQP